MTTFTKGAAATLATLALTGCTSPPAPGELGTPRYIDNVGREPTPLPMAPPIHDRDGNAYVAYGDIETLEVEAFIGHKGRGWSGSCTILSEAATHGFHGWVGRSQNQAWYWAGTAFVRMSGTAGGCVRRFDNDPSSGARLDFLAILPNVRVTPSLTSIVALIKAPLELPYVALIDLNADRYVALDEFDPSDADPDSIEVLGVGADTDLQEGVMVVRYTVGEQTRTEARFYDFEANLLETVRISGLEETAAYGLRGFLHADETGLWAGLDRGRDRMGAEIGPPRMLVLDKSGAAVKTPNMETPIGVHKWEGQLYLVGENGGRPVVAPLDGDGDLRSPKVWDASLEFVDSLGSKIQVLDDRSLPSRRVDWRNPRTAVGNFPFLSEHRLDYFATGTTAWLIAGPSFGEATTSTAVAYVPTGVAYED